MNMLSQYKQFFHYFGNRYRRYVPLVVIGAAVAGMLEIAGLLLLLPFIRLLVRPEAIEKNRWLGGVMDFFRMTTPLQQACFLGILILLVFVAKNIYLIGYHFWQNRILRRWKIEISTTLMRFYLLAPYKLHLETTTERITRNVNNVVLNALNNFIFQGFLLISNIIVGLIVLSILLTRFFLFAMLTAFVLAVTSLCQYYLLRRKLKSLGKQKDDLQSRQYKSIFQGLHAIKETKVLGREQFFLNSFENVNRSTMDNDMWTLFYGQLPPYVTEISAILCVVIMSIGVIHSTRNDNPAMIASLGVLAAIAFRTATIVNRILKSLQQINHGQHAMEILLEEIQTPLWQEYQQNGAGPRSPDPEPLPFSHQIRFENVRFTYPKARKPALDCINLDIQRGEFVGIVGQSGAGKTTLVDLLLGLLQPQHGRILVDGVPLEPENMAGWRAHLGYVPQHVYISNESAYRNVAFGLSDQEIDTLRVEQTLRQANLYEHLSRLPDGLMTPLGENGRKLSGGEKQRIGIARALYRDADVLVLDEATSSLDVQTESQITRAIAALKGMRTIIAIAHRLSTLKSCDRILYFRKGRLVDFGTFASLSARHPDFERMLKLSKI
ncbi:MAG: ABC transporter ATP-binding protein/permease [Planctomycetaceae bacterium]|nr:ABC transporter ATP-binding protein/permease [Planctomycetaceae bacterium]